MTSTMRLLLCTALGLAAGCRYRYYGSVGYSRPAYVHAAYAQPTYVQPTYVAPAPQPTYVAAQPGYVANPPLAYATPPSGNGTIYLNAGQPLSLPNSDLPIQAISAVVIQTSDGRQMTLTQADLASGAIGGRLSLSIPPGISAGTATVYLVDGRQLSFPFQVNVTVNGYGG